jgi:L-lactate dehydrogenase (cytochrome)
VSNAWVTTSRILILGQDEFEMAMRLLGAPTLKDVVPSMVDTSNIHTHIVSVPEDKLYMANCERQHIR